MNDRTIAREDSTLGIAVIAMVVMLALGLLNLGWPFTGDQALFTLGAREISEGAILYRDFWDLKQPGIYWFYLAAGKCFGFTEIGVHSLELVYFLAFAALVIAVTKKYYRTKWGPVVAALLGVGVYFVVASEWHLTQIEALVGPPLFFCLWTMFPPGEMPRSWALRAIVGGALTGVVVVFKLALVLIPAAFFLLAVIELLRRRETKSVASVIAFGFIGFVIALAPVFLYFGPLGQLGEMYRTFFVYPPRITTELPHNPPHVLLSGLRWITFAAGPMIPFALVAMVHWLRTRDDRFTLGLFVWAVVALGVVLLQRMWWQYHFVLLLMPIAFLATGGLEKLAPLMRSRRWIAFAVAMVLVFPYAFRVTGKAVRLMREPVAVVRPRSELLTNVVYAPAVRSTQFLMQPDAIAGPIYVIGNPVWYYVSNREQAIAINGWSPEWFVAEQWKQVVDQLRAARPPYIYVDAQNASVLQARGQVITQLLAEDYVEYIKEPSGVWYARRSGPVSQPRLSIETSSKP